MLFQAAENWLAVTRTRRNHAGLLRSWCLAFCGLAFRATSSWHRAWYDLGVRWLPWLCLGGGSVHCGALCVLRVVPCCLASHVAMLFQCRGRVEALRNCVFVFFRSFLLLLSDDRVVRPCQPQPVPMTRANSASCHPRALTSTPIPACTRARACPVDTAPTAPLHARLASPSTTVSAAPCAHALCPAPQHGRHTKPTALSPDRRRPLAPCSSLVLAPTRLLPPAHAPLRVGTHASSAPQTPRPKARGCGTLTTPRCQAPPPRGTRRSPTIHRATNTAWWWIPSHLTQAPAAGLTPRARWHNPACVHTRMRCAPTACSTRIKVKRRWTAGHRTVQLAGRRCHRRLVATPPPSPRTC